MRLAGFYHPDVVSREETCVASGGVPCAARLGRQVSHREVCKAVSVTEAGQHERVKS